MITDLTENDLIQFEKEIAKNFNEAKIKAPVHLYYGNEKQIIKVFEKINTDDWVFCSWRSHYQCLLKGVPRTKLKNEIMKGLSISLCFSDYRIYSSAIVGGSLPIAVGTALSIKKSNKGEKVFCFLGDMTSETGIAHECIKYSINYDLPIEFIIEDNNLSVCSDTRKVWQQHFLTYENFKNPKVTFYKYKNIYPHAGAGKRVQF
jgi:pyruvate dehydrogenase E1 component alpha subunit